MTGAPVAVAHYCEGAGHATRMLAIATAIEREGHEIVLAGGGPGAPFVEENGYEEFEPTPVDFVTDFQRDGHLAMLRRSVPNLFRRIREYRGWLDRHEPTLLVTDDITAAIAAATGSTPYHYLAHDPAELYETATERLGARVRNGIPLRTAEHCYFPKVWSGDPAITGAEPVGPIAPQSEPIDASVDVLLVPSAFSLDRERLIGRLVDRGHEVTVVGGEDWEIVPSLQPYVEAASLVVCSGYSTIMEAAVAGTPCLVVPHTSEQRGVARAIAGRRGFYSAETLAEIESLLDDVEPPEPSDNGVPTVVERVTDVLAGR